jgi:precorrin-6A synthase
LPTRIGNPHRGGPTTTASEIAGRTPDEEKDVRLMREILVIGIGAGNPEYITVQAINALNAADVFFVVEKGAEKSGLLALRQEICDRYIRDRTYRVVPIPEPERDRRADADAYTDAVADWHERRAALFEAAIIEHLPADGRGAFLVWGDPALYDSTLRTIDRILARGAVQFDYRVIPGITSVQALAAQHRLPLNRIGEPVHITTGRRLSPGLPDGLRSAVVMLDPGLAAADLDDPDLHIYWGAYLGTPDEELRSGRLHEVAQDIAETKRELRRRHGWIMDTYLIRRESP